MPATTIAPEPPPEDKLIACCDCGKPFVWAAAEQQYYASLRLSQPKRCASCRAIRKARITPAVQQ